MSDRAIHLLQRILSDCDRRSRVYGDAAIGLSGDVRHEAQILIAEHQFTAPAASTASGPTTGAAAGPDQGVSK